MDSEVPAAGFRSRRVKNIVSRLTNFFEEEIKNPKLPILSPSSSPEPIKKPLLFSNEERNHRVQLRSQAEKLLGGFLLEKRRQKFDATRVFTVTELIDWIVSGSESDKRKAADELWRKIRDDENAEKELIGINGVKVLVGLLYHDAQAIPRATIAAVLRYLGLRSLVHVQEMKNAGIFDIVAFLMRFGSDDERCVCAGILIAISKYEPCKIWFIQSGMLNLIQTQLELSYQRAAFCRLLLAILMELSKQPLSTVLNEKLMHPVFLETIRRILIRGCDAVTAAAACYVCSLTKIPENRKGLVQSQLLDPLIEILHRGSEEGVSASASAIGELAISDELKIQLCKKCAPQLILLLTPDNLVAFRARCNAVSTLKIMASRRRSQEYMIEYQAVPKLVQVFRACAEQKEYQELVSLTCERSLHILGTLVALSNTHEYILEQGILPIMINRLKCKEEGHQVASARALRNLSVIEAGRDAIVAEPGALKLLLHIAVLDASRASVYATGTIRNIAVTPKHKKVLVLSGTIGTLIRVLQKGKEESEDSLANAASALTNMAANSKQCKKLCIAAGALKWLVATMEIGSSPAMLIGASSAIGALITHEDADNKIKEVCGVGKALLKFLFNNYFPLKISLLKTMRNVSATEFGLKELVEEGAVLQLLSLMENSKRDQEEVPFLCSAVLRNICTHPEGSHQLVTNPNSMSSLVRYIHSSQDEFRAHLIVILQHFVSHDVSFCEELLLVMGIVPRLVADLTLSDANAAVACSAILGRLIVNSEFAQVAAVKAGMISICLDLFSSSAEGIKINTTALIWQISKNPEHFVDLRSAGTIPHLEHLSCFGSARVKRNASRALEEMEKIQAEIMMKNEGMEGEGTEEQITINETA